MTITIIVIIITVTTANIDCPLGTVLKTKMSLKAQQPYEVDPIIRPFYR